MLDEPTAHLDHATATDLAAEVMAPSDRTVIWISHEPTGLGLTDRVLDLGAAAYRPGGVVRS